MSARNAELELELELELEGEFEEELEFEGEGEEFLGTIARGLGGLLGGGAGEGEEEYENEYEYEAELELEEEGEEFARDPALGRYAPSPRAVGAPARGATLAALRTFTRNYVRGMVRRRRRIDCADLAIEVWIRFGERYRVPVSFRVWDASGRRWLTASRAGVRAGRTVVRRFSSYAAFVRWVQSNLGARGLIANTFAVPGGHRRAVAGDVFLWQYRNNRTRALAGVGHTQILDGVVRGPGGLRTDTINVYQGNLPPAVPQLRRLPAPYFYRNRMATIRGAPHTGIPVGPGPRRFNSFRSLR